MNKFFMTALFLMVPCMLFAQKKVSRASAMNLGKAIYTQRCATCHQVDGKCAQNMIPPLIKTEYVLGDKTRLIGIVLNGLNGEIKVNGDTYGNEMPGHQDLKDAEIAAVLTYVRNSFGNKATAVSIAAVQRVRATAKTP